MSPVRLSSSICIMVQNDSIIALSSPSPSDPNDGISPACRMRSVNTQEVNWLGPMNGMHDATRSRVSVLDGHVESVDDAI